MLMYDTRNSSIECQQMAWQCSRTLAHTSWWVQPISDGCWSIECMQWLFMVQFKLFVTWWTNAAPTQRSYLQHEDRVLHLLPRRWGRLTLPFALGARGAVALVARQPSICVITKRWPDLAKWTVSFQDENLFLNVIPTPVVTADMQMETCNIEVADLITFILQIAPKHQ